MKKQPRLPYNTIKKREIKDRFMLTSALSVGNGISVTLRRRL